MINSRRRFLLSVVGLVAGGRSLLAGATTTSVTPARTPVAADPQTGVAIRFVQQYDVTRHAVPTRLDCYYGAFPFGPPLACRIEG